MVKRQWLACFAKRPKPPAAADAPASCPPPPAAPDAGGPAAADTGAERDEVVEALQEKVRELETIVEFEREQRRLADSYTKQAQRLANAHAHPETSALLTFPVSPPA